MLMPQIPRLNSFHLCDPGNQLLRPIKRGVGLRARAPHTSIPHLSHHKVVGSVAPVSCSKTTCEGYYDGDGDGFQDDRRPLPGPPSGAHPEPRPGDADPLLPLRLLRRQTRMLRPMAPARYRRRTVSFPGRGTVYCFAGRYHRCESRAGRVSQGLCRKLAVMSVTSSKFSLARLSSYETGFMWVPLLAPR